MIAHTEPTKCGCGSPKPSGGGCSCQAASRSDCACSQKRKPPGGATCCKAGGSCTCQNGLRSPPPHSKADVDPIHVGMLGAPLTRRSDELDAPPVVVPRDCVIRCDPPHEELRPPRSFLDCRWYLLTQGVPRVRVFVEPPQSAELEIPSRARVPVLAAPPETESSPVPPVAAARDGTAVCEPESRARVTSPRFSRIPLCDLGVHELPEGEQPPLVISPQDPRGKGGEGERCKCVCSCPKKGGEVEPQLLDSGIVAESYVLAPDSPSDLVVCVTCGGLRDHVDLQTPALRHAPEVFDTARLAPGTVHPPLVVGGPSGLPATPAEVRELGSRSHGALSPPAHESGHEFASPPGSVVADRRPVQVGDSDFPVRIAARDAPGGEPR